MTGRVLFTSQKKEAVVTPQMVVQAASRGQRSDFLISVAGPITVDSSPDLRTRLLRCLREPDCEGLVVDLFDVDYVDTSALAVLLEVFKAARTLNKNFELRRLRHRPHYLFEAIGLLRL